MKKRGIDAMLDEIDEARRTIMAEHGNDWRKVLAFYMELDQQRREQEARAQDADARDKSAA